MIHGNKIALLSIALLFIVSVTCLGQSHSKSKTSFSIPSKTEYHIIDIIFKLPEVKRRIAYVKKQTHNKRHIQVGILSKPTKEKPYYLVEVMEDNGITMHIHFNFYVYPQNFLIKYLDAANDSVLTLEDWRKSADHPKR